jgi:hypothetical protein
MESNIYEHNIQTIKDSLGSSTQLIIKEFIVGTSEEIEGAALYINGLANKEVIDRAILQPLMLHVNDNAKNITSISYLCKKYLTISSSEINIDICKGIEELKRGKTLIFLSGFNEFIITDTVGGQHREISDPVNETSVRSIREGFVENLEINLSIIKRRLKDKNLTSEKFVLGRRTETDVVMLYIKDIANESIVNEIRNRLASIDIDATSYTGIIEQLIEKHTYSIFPQVFATERPDVMQANLLEGRIGILVEGSPFVITLPCIFIEFFQTVEDYFHRTLVSSFVRLIRLIAVVSILTAPAIYITMIKFNSELIPLKFVKTIVESRKGIALTPFMSILAMSITIELLREGGLRLPAKIGQTISVVGGIIIGDAALQAKIVSPTTLLVVGIVTASTFVIPNYEMSLSIRLLSFPMLVLGNALGMYGVILGVFFIICYLCSLDSFGIPYLYFHKKDLKDIFIRDAIWRMKERPQIILGKDKNRQENVKKRKGENNES